MSLILKVVGYSSAAWYGKKQSQPKQKPGPKPKCIDTDALKAIKTEIQNSIFHSEGYIKVKKRLDRDGIIIAKHRVNLIMRENKLLSPVRPVKDGRKNKHEGTITTTSPNIMWATDGKKFYTEKEGWCWFFGVIDHFNDEIISWHIQKIGNRYAAMTPVQRAVKKIFHSLDKGVCKNTALQLRSDHGTQYDSKDFMNEMKFLGLDMSKAYVRSPECNGIIERFHRTLNEQVFDVTPLKSLDHAHLVLDKFINNYNNKWMLHRLKLKSPIDYRIRYEKTG
ncbi:MAG: integrase core domain-containing protein [Nanoarchaeota archaeon]|nr:integrase core domain-containing protein [Nanoarchaeota archaeon]